MALKGSFSGTTSNSRIKPTITWWAVQSVEGNWSDITVVLTYSRTNTGYSTGGKWTGSITVGTQTVTASKTIKITQNSNTEAMRATVRVQHNNYGEAAVTVSATGAIAVTTLTSTTISARIELDAIARASGISATNADIGSRSTVVVSRKNDTFTHSIAYRFGALSGYIDENGNVADAEVKLSGTILNFLLPESFYHQIPDAPTGVCSLTCTTYSGDTPIGSPQTGSFTVTAGVESSKPVVSGAVWDVNEKTVALTGDERVLVRYASVARCRIDAQPRNGASITALRIGGAAVTDGVLDIKNPAFDTVTFEATDSRGYTTICQIPVTVIPYVMLTNNATLQRTEPTSGNGALKLQGNCWQGNFGARSNSLSYQYTVDGGSLLHDWLTIDQNSTYQETQLLEGLDYRTAHTVELTVSDAIMSVTKTLKISKGIPVFDWGENDFVFHVPVALPELTVDGMSLADYIYKEVKEWQK